MRCRGRPKYERVHIPEPSRPFPTPLHANKIPGGYVVRDAGKRGAWIAVKKGLGSLP
jgi:hypothetical protein